MCTQMTNFRALFVISSSWLAGDWFSSVVKVKFDCISGKATLGYAKACLVVEPVFKQCFGVPLGKTSGCKLVPPVAGDAKWALAHWERMPSEEWSPSTHRWLLRSWAGGSEELPLTQMDLIRLLLKMLLGNNANFKAPLNYKNSRKIKEDVSSVHRKYLV